MKSLGDEPQKDVSERMMRLSTVFSLEKRLHSADQAGSSQSLRLSFATRLIFSVGNPSVFP